ncbi:intestinal mucin-like protein [Bombina bombina]|uniref:intestinal mucin-like protein n=1 Tax=Bombina bombina TaxID=8345 RepID=UPI00235AB6A0|nr:intestinal mucin-like protein [Bombina bombina]
MYKVGNSIWTDKSSCRECHCSNESNPITGLNVIKCISLICMTNCPQGYTYQKSPSACCGECVQVSCIVKYPSGSLYLLKPGESQSFKEDNCTQYSCKLINNNFVTSSQTQSCPKIREEECESVDIIKAPDGCCDICKVPKTCMVQKKMTRITYKDCYADVILSYCEGLCPSSTVFSTNTMNMLTTCGCCQELTAIKKIINLFCPLTNKSIQISVIVAVSCGCTSKVCKA